MVVKFWLSDLVSQSAGKSQRHLLILRRHSSSEEFKLAGKLSSFFRSQGRAGLVNSLTPQIVDKVLCGQRDAISALRNVIWAGQQSQSRHTVCTYQEVIKKSVDEGLWKSLWQLISEMRNDGYAITPTTLMIIITCHEAAGLVEEAHCKPSTALYSCILDVLIKANSLEKANASMAYSACFPDMATLNIYKSGLCKVAKPIDAERLLRDPFKHGLYPDERTYTTLLLSFIEVDMLDESLRIFNEMQSKGFDPNGGVCDKLLTSLCKAYRFEDAKSVLETVKEVGPSALVSHTIVILALCKESRVGDVIKLRSMLKEKGIISNTFLCKHLLAFFSENGRAKEVFSLLEECSNNDVSLYEGTCELLVSNFCNASKSEHIPELLKKLSQFGFIPDNSRLRGLNWTS